jgi:Clostripain family
MRRGSFIMLAVAIALVCVLAPVASAAGSAPVSKAWTVMVYIDGDNNLEDYVVKDIETELSALGSNASVNVVCIADRGPGYDTSRGDWQTTKVYYCTQGMLADAASAVADWGERNMGDPQTLRDFVTWAKTNYPASNYLLAFWDHGYMTFQGYTSVDDSSGGDALDEDEQVAAMATAGPVGVVAWDMCNRQMLEVAADWQPFALAMAGSESYTNWEGIQYDAVIAALRATPAMTAQQVSDKIALTALGDSDTFSSLALDARFTTLMTAVDQWALALKSGLPVYKSAYLSARRSTVSYYSIAFDLWQLAANVKAKVADPTIKARCDAVMAAAAACTTANWTSGNKQFNKSKGLAVWMPSTRQQLTPYSPTDFTYYRTLRLNTQTSWDEFLAALCQ